MYDLMMPLYGIVHSITLLTTIHLFYKPIKKKYLVVLFLFLFIFNSTMIYTYSTTTVFMHLMNGIIISIYYFINCDKASILGYGHILTCVYLPFCLTPLFSEYVMSYILNLSILQTIVQANILYKYYHYFRLIPEILSHILVVIIFMVYKHFTKKKYFQSSYLSLFCALIMLTPMALVYAKTVYDSVLNTSTYFISFVSILLLGILFYNYYHSIKEEVDTEIEKTRLQLELEKNRLIYKNYENEYDRMLELKHQVVSKLKNHTGKEYLNEVDKLLTPYIHYFTENKVLNMLLVEKTMMMDEKKIPYEILLHHSLDFLKEDEIMLLIGLFIDELLKDSLSYFELRTFEKGNNHLIIIDYVITKPIDLQTIYPAYFLTRLENDYKMTYFLEEKETHSLISFNLVFQKNNF